MKNLSLPILYFGDATPGSTSGHRVSTLARLGYQVLTLDPANCLNRRSKWRNWFNYRTGYRFCQAHLRYALGKELARLQSDFSVVWVNSGELLGPSILLWLRTLYACPFVLYCNDDPTGQRDWKRFSSLRAALSSYDLCVCTRDVNRLEWLALGAQALQCVWMSFDEEIHLVDQLFVQPNQRLSFIGTNIPAERRDDFLYQLHRAEVPLAIHGTRWQRSRHWPRLRTYCHPAFAVDSGYTTLLSEDALCLGLLSHGNRDLHTTRSLEAPAASTVLLAERTSEHQLLYEDGVEALLWQNPQECVDIAKQSLSNSSELDSVRKGGHQRVTEMGVGNEDICRQVLASLEALPD